MSQRIITEMLDDIDGSKAAESVQFGLDGKSYTIDLSNENASRLREGLSRYVASASLQSNKQTKPARQKQAQNGENSQKIREWAKANGYDIQPRGRISQEITQKYLAAQTASAGQIPSQQVPLFTA
jgi:Lsr2